MTKCSKCGSYNYDVDTTDTARATVIDILRCLNCQKQRATYGAVADVIDVHPRDVSHYLGDYRPFASWVVNSGTGEPTGYQQNQLHPDLHQNGKIIHTGEELKKLCNLGG